MSEEANKRFREKNPTYWRDIMRKRRLEKKEKMIAEAMKDFFNEDYPVDDNREQ